MAVRIGSTSDPAVLKKNPSRTQFFRYRFGFGKFRQCTLARLIVGSRPIAEISLIAPNLSVSCPKLSVVDVVTELLAHDLKVSSHLSNCED